MFNHAQPIASICNVVRRRGTAIFQDNLPKQYRSMRAVCIVRWSVSECEVMSRGLLAGESCDSNAIGTGAVDGLARRVGRQSARAIGPG